MSDYQALCMNEDDRKRLKKENESKKTLLYVKCSAF